MKLCYTCNWNLLTFVETYFRTCIICGVEKRNLGKHEIQVETRVSTKRKKCRNSSGRKWLKYRENKLTSKNGNWTKWRMENKNICTKIFYNLKRLYKNIYPMRINEYAFVATIIKICSYWKLFVPFKLYDAEIIKLSSHFFWFRLETLFACTLAQCKYALQ